MSLVHANNFELYELGTDGWIALKATEGWEDGDSATADGCEIVEGGWHASRALHVPPGAIGTLPVSLTGATRILCVQGAFKLDALPSEQQILFSFTIVQLRLNPDGSLTIESPSGATTSEAGFVKPGQWHYLEAKAHQGTAACRMSVMIDGLDVAAMTGIQTSTGSSTHSVNLNSANVGVTWSEVIVIDGAGSCNDLLGVDARITLLQPFASSANLWTWLPEGSTLHSRLADPLPGPADGLTSISTTVIGASYYVTFGSPPPARRFEAVTLLLEALRLDGGSPLFATRVTSNGRVVESADISPDVGETVLSRVTLSRDPSGGRPWSRKGLAELRFGAVAKANPI